MKALIQNSRPPTLNPGPPEYEAEVLTTHPFLARHTSIQ
jgi:hypothetical protein